MKPIVAVVVALLGSVGCRAGISPPPASASIEPGDHHPSAWLEIDRGVFESNIRALRALVGDSTKICPVMKADAYGHGIRMLAPSLLALDVPCAAIGSNEEAQVLREAGFRKQILRLRPAGLDEIESGIRLDVDEPVGSLALAKAIAGAGLRTGRVVRLHLSLDSGGMSRGELDLGTDQSRAETLEILKLPGTRVVGIMTHFPVEDRNDVLRGLGTFRADAAWIIDHGRLDRQSLTLHCANSFATLEVPESRLDMVRPGGALYGDTVPRFVQFKRVMQFKSRVTAINWYPARKTVGYERTFVLSRDSRLATVSVGYSNGYWRALSNRMTVLIGGKRCRVVGRVSMNLMTVDVTDVPQVRAGDEVVLFGRQGTDEITQAELEASSGTIFAELYTMWGASNPRVLKSR